MVPRIKIDYESMAFDTDTFLRSEHYEKIRADLKRYSGKERKIYWIGKRLFDVAGSAAALVVLSPLLLVILIIIFLDDPHGSPFYSQTRIGRHGKAFKMWKFRSMVVNADELLDQLQEKNEKDGPMFKIKNDPRITRVGRFIRKTSIDELPQLWNVLCGDMSFVGPRPSLPKEVVMFTEFQKQRLLVTPGLTCIWQTSPKRDTIGFDEWVALDIRYIFERSWWLDLKLIFKTIKVVICGDGS